MLPLPPVANGGDELPSHRSGARTPAYARTASLLATLLGAVGIAAREWHAFRVALACAFFGAGLPKSRSPRMGSPAPEDAGERCSFRNMALSDCAPRLNAPAPLARSHKAVRGCPTSSRRGRPLVYNLRSIGSNATFGTLRRRRQPIRVPARQLRRRRLLFTTAVASTSTATPTAAHPRNRGANTSPSAAARPKVTLALRFSRLTKRLIRRLSRRYAPRRLGYAHRLR